MPAPKNNQYAAKPEGQKHGDQFNLRAPAGLKGRAVRVSRARNMKLTPYILEAIEEKIARDEKELARVQTYRAAQAAFAGDAHAPPARPLSESLIV